MNVMKAIEDGYTTKNGLLYLNDSVCGVSHADRAAMAYGYMYAEQLVRALKDMQWEYENNN